MCIVLFRHPLAIHPPPPMSQVFHVDSMYNNRHHLANPFHRRCETAPHHLYGPVLCMDS
ncbi:hypothetical protein BGY98DRAFT_1007378 [Russula aff. rugulosa BPL654]|nr:hypothetical protein BGY98DRAFT_1007378 [Russula aff. rugulosa BPL654]